MSRPNIIWITIDSLRADHTSMHGYRRDTTPRINKLANSPTGIAFKQCISHGMWTLPSTASILTGTTPSHHQTWNPMGSKIPALSDELKTAPELLNEIGYNTVGISRNPYFSPGTNLDRGFDMFNLLYPKTLPRTVGIAGIVKYLLKIRKHSAGFCTDLHRHSTAFLVSYLVKRQLSQLEKHNDPFFLYAHYNEPHTAYHPPLPYLDYYADATSLSAQQAADFATERHHRKDVKAEKRVNYTEDEWTALKAMYDAEIRYTDKMVGEVIDYINCNNIPAIVVITADHGDLFGEYGLTGHVHCLHDGLIHVPLVISGVTHEVRRKSTQVVQHSDIMETILSDVGIKSSQFQGVNLVEDSRDFAVSQRSSIDPEDVPEGIHAPMLSCIRNKRWKYQYSEDGEELFELPSENIDKSEQFTGIRDELSNRLQSFLDVKGNPVSGTTTGRIDAAMRKRLRNLGYME